MIVHSLRLAPALGLVLLTAVSAPAAPPTLTYLFPAGGQRGQTVAVTAGGSFERWPVQAWADHPGIQVTAAKAKGNLSVTVRPDVPPGTHWLRVHDGQGASVLRAFIVGDLPEVAEQEPNDDPRKPQKLSAAATVVNGRLGRPGEVDCFAVSLRQGQTLVAAVEANRLLGSPMDAVLQVLSADGFVLDQNNDYCGLDPQIVFAVPKDGAYVIRVFAFPAVPDAAIRLAGGETFIYRLTVTTGGFVDHAVPLAVARSQPGMVELAGWNIPPAARTLPVSTTADANLVTLAHPGLANVASVRLEPHASAKEVEPNDRRQPQAVALPVTVSGRIDPAGDLDVFEFAARKGQSLRVQIETAGPGCPLAPVLRLTDAAGEPVAQPGDAPRPRGRGNRRGRGVPQATSELAFTAPHAGTYRVEISDQYGEGSWRHAYRLRLLTARPDYDLKLAADQLTLTPGKELSVPVTVERRDGFAGEIDIRAVGLPDGVTASPVKSAPGGAAVGSATLKLLASRGGVSGPFRIIGGAGQPSLSRTATAAVPDPVGSVAYVWLTVQPTASGREKPTAKGR